MSQLKKKNESKWVSWKVEFKIYFKKIELYFFSSISRWFKKRKDNLKFKNLKIHE